MRCSLFVVCCLLFAVCCSWCVVFVRVLSVMRGYGMLFVVCGCLWSVVCCCCLIVVAVCVSLVDGCSLFAVRRLLLVVC